MSSGGGNRAGELGFTLAEVLITLGIIGIVAALTIPQLISNYQKKVVPIRLKKMARLIIGLLVMMMKL